MLSYLGEMIDLILENWKPVSIVQNQVLKDMRPLFLAANMDKLAISYPMDYYEWDWTGLRGLEIEVELSICSGWHNISNLGNRKKHNLSSQLPLPAPNSQNTYPQFTDY